jgi:molybdenum cofactor biosynthesis enzyme MoaA
VTVSAALIRHALNAAKKGGAKSIAISGGEPLISPCLKDVLDAVCDLALPAHVTTNGTSLEDKAASLAESGVTTIHLSLESIEGRVKFAPDCEMDTRRICSAISAARNVGLNVEINHLVLRGLNWSPTQLGRMLDFCAAEGAGLNILDLLYTWNQSLESLYVPYMEVRNLLEQQFKLVGHVVPHHGTIQTRYCYGNVAIYLRDFRPVPSSSLCATCSTECGTFGVTPPQLSTAGTIGICKHTRKQVGESEQEVEENVMWIWRRVKSGGQINWLRT